MYLLYGMVQFPRVTSHPHDDGFHEIQLNGKQLVFLFMAATVVSVVIFLCGVLVGRGVRAERGVIAQVAAMNETPTPDVVPAVPPTASAIQASADPTTAAPPPTVDELSYVNRLEKATDQAADDLKPAAAKPVQAPAPSAAKPLPVAAATTPAPAASPAPAPGDGYAVQVAAVNVRGDADAIVKRLASKGYSAYVQVPPNSTGAVFRVRVGTFKTRREADAVAARLQKEEQIKPWVTR